MTTRTRESIGSAVVLIVLTLLVVAVWGYGQYRAQERAHMELVERMESLKPPSFE